MSKLLGPKFRVTHKFHNSVLKFAELCERKNCRVIYRKNATNTTSPVDHLPMQNLPNMFDNTSSDMFSPLISPRANAASLKSIVQKSMGNSSLIDNFNLDRDSWALSSCSNCLCLSHKK